MSSPIIAQIPQELKNFKQWVIYKLISKGNGKTDKPLFSPSTGGHASHSDPKTCNIFEEALNVLQSNNTYQGLGFVFSYYDPFCGIDFDDCRNPETGEIDPEALTYIKKLDSYTEISPSGKGLHVIVKAKLPGGGRKDTKKSIEVYDTLRYFTVTGHHLTETPLTINDRQKEFDEFYKEIFEKKTEKLKNELIEKARNAKNGHLFSTLYNGDWEAGGYPSHSEADQALCNMLAFWTDRDATRMDSFFRQSGLYRPKWDKKHFGDGRTYGQATIRKAIDSTPETYKPEPEETIAKKINEEPWEKPLPLQSYNLPLFPVDIFPDWLGGFVSGISIATQTPKDLAGMLVLPISSTAVAGKFIVQLREGWWEPLNLFIISVLPPGERKSAVFAECAEPIEEFEKEESERLAPEIAEAKTQKKILEERLRLEQGKSAKLSGLEAKEAEQVAGRVAVELSEFEVLVPPRFIADDVSPEKLTSLLAEQKGKIAVLSAEGGIFDIVAGRYSQNNSCNFEVFLKGHAGDTLRVDRIGRPPEYIKKPALTVGITVQPEVLRGLLEKPGFRGRGFLARFLYSLPASQVGRRKINSPPLKKEIKKQYYRGIINLLNLPLGPEGKPFVLKLSGEATLISNEFEEWLEPKLGTNGELELITDWAAKLHGAVARIAGILHLTEHVNNNSPWEMPVSAESFEKAICLGKYLIEHAKAAFTEMGADSKLDDAKYVLRWVERQDLKMFSKRDAFNAGRGRFKTVDDLEPTLKILVDYGYIREQSLEQKNKPGRKPSPIFEVNPLPAHYAHYAQMEDKVNSAYSAYSANPDGEKNNDMWKIEF